MRVISPLLAYACLACSAPGAQAVDTSKLIWTKDKKRPWCFAWWPRKITLPCTVCEPEASTGTCKNNQGKGKVIKVLGAVASIAFGVALLPFKK